ncbi:M10 family metallopeptidase C-terminal domain-containing protein [Sphingosinicella sp. BN140058]|uniref:M10 family metallopeptidase C-terminal domain-containing protein n=1 Tax=Sphingosinicella sp. BN140058 TaxID=1892855 RepID=UPI0010111AC9|nr:M10 family metallopeptidase C-terminal domain-containing protein [Sphingosinicella sp. BN140058]QAY75822.1 calcium-binding protein [Sphingosinicella sp. BN140058]
MYASYSKGLTFHGDGFEPASTSSRSTLPADPVLAGSIDRASGNAIAYEGDADAAPLNMGAPTIAAAVPTRFEGVGPVAALEGVPVALFAGATVSAEADQLNGGLGDYYGYSLVFSASSRDSEWILEGGKYFTVEPGLSESVFDLIADGKKFGRVALQYEPDPYVEFPRIAIDFFNPEAIATSALVDDVLQSMHYRNRSNTPADQVSTGLALTYFFQSVAYEEVPITITPVNDAPVNLLPTVQFTSKAEQLVFSIVNGNAITVSDPDTDMLQVTLDVAHGALTLADTAGLTFVTGDGQGDATMTFRGNSAAINAALDGLFYQGAFDFHGEDSLTVTTDDLGGTGIGGALTDQDSIAIILTPNDDLPGTAGNDTLVGSGNADRFLLQQGGDDRASGGAGSDLFVFGAKWNARDSVDGGAGRDTVQLTGKYDYHFEDNQLTGIERLLLIGGPTGVALNYHLDMADGNVAAGARLLVDARDLVRTETLTFNAAAEQDGSYEVFGGFGGDIITGGVKDDLLSGLNGADRLYGGTGDDRLSGNLGADLLVGGEGADVFVYRSAAESTSFQFDTIEGFNPSEDRIDLPFTLTHGWADFTGALNRDTFSADIARNVELWGPTSVTFFRPDSGDFAGRTFAVIDANDDGVYTAVQDYVIEFSNPTMMLQPNMDIFI